MKKLLIIFILAAKIIFLGSCAKPTVVNVVLPGDNELNCKQLEIELAESQKIKRDAEFAKGNTGGNITRIMLFWPAWAKTFHNADVAIQAADDRIFHLFKIMKEKKCANASKVEDQILKLETSLTGQLKELKKMYKDGDLTKEEYKKAKKKLLED